MAEKNFIPGIPVPKINPSTGKVFSSLDEKKQYIEARRIEIEAKKEQLRPIIEERRAQKELELQIKNQAMEKLKTFLLSNNFTEEEFSALFDHK